MQGFYAVRPDSRGKIAPKLILFCSMTVEKSPARERAILVLVLFFVKLGVYAVNGRRVPASHRAVYVWSAALVFTSMTGVSEITKRNVMAEAIPFVFLTLQRDVTKPGLATSEGAEHTHGMLRTVRREFTMLEFIQMIAKVTRRLNLMFRNDYLATRDPQKGYASTFRAFIELSRDEGMPEMDGSVVIDRNGAPVVQQTRDTVKETTSFASKIIRPLLDTVGVKEGERSPFCREFSSP